MPRGTVVAFDDHKGYGAVRDDEGVERFFHCTAVADGSRHVEVGAVVDFVVEPGHLGRWEAGRLVPVGTGPAGVSAAS